MDKDRISRCLEIILKATEELYANLDDDYIDYADYIGIIEESAVEAFMDLNGRAGEDPEAILDEILGENQED